MGVGFAGWAEKSDIQVGSVQPGMPAEKAGLRKGDLLITANGASIHSRYRLQEVIRSSEGNLLISSLHETASRAGSPSSGAAKAGRR